MPKITASSAVLLVKDVQASANYLRDAAGFDREPFFMDEAGVPGFCICHRDGHYLMLARVDEGVKIMPNWRLREKTCDVYFWVDDADALYEEMKSRGAKMDYGPCTQPYGVREFGIQDLDDHDIAFGQVLR